MRTEAHSPWPLLLSKLRQANRSKVTHAELKAAGLDPQALLDARLIERLESGGWRAPDCEHSCTPALDFDTRRAEGLVGVACPYEPACWPGVKWHPVGIVEMFCCSAENVFCALHASNGLVPLDVPIGKGVVPVGILNRRGMKLPVVWMLQPLAPFEEVCLGLRQKLGGDGLVVLLGRGSTTLAAPPAKVAVLDLMDDGTGNLHLYRALDRFDPTYRQRRVDDPTALFDDVQLEFADEPGLRHIVKINGQEYGGFQNSDVKFNRLLLLAAARASDPDVENGGWIQKARLRGGEDRDRDLEKIRKELHEHSHPGLTNNELKALIKSKKGTGEIRLAVPPMNIRFDESLRRFQFIGASHAKGKQLKKRRTPGMADLDRNLADGRANAGLLLKDARKLGVPCPDVAKGKGG